MIRSFKYLMLILILVFPNIVKADLDGYLKKGTYALNPANKKDIFLYLPGKTLLYSIKPDEIKVGSIAFPNLRRTYVQATTQDGIDVLVLKSVVRMDVGSLSKYDFLVNRRLPLCLKLDSSDSIWSDFNRKADQGDDWIAIWARAGGIFLENIQGMQKVKIDAGGWEDGFIPLKRGQFTIEDYGYITNLKRYYPLYRFKQKELPGLSTKCNEIISQEKRKAIFTKLEAYGKLAASVRIDPSGALPSIIPRKYMKLLLESLGLEASISAEAFLDGKWKEEDLKIDTATNIYGQKGERWQVFDVFVEKRGLSELGTDSDYQPYGRILIKKIYGCYGSEASVLKYASVTLTFYNDNGNIIDNSDIHIPIDSNIIRNEIGIAGIPVNCALVSVSSQRDHFKLVDYFLEKGIPKSIANLLITHINLSKSQK